MRIHKFLLIVGLASCTIFYSCETFNLENVTDPNALSPENSNPDLLLNAIQLDYWQSMTFLNNLGARLGRIDQFSGGNYFGALGAGTLNFPWTTLYSGIIPDIAILEGLQSDDNDLSFHLGISYAMEAHILMGLVDNLGDIVYSQANNPSEYPTPELDDDQEVYNAALALLDKAKTLLTGASSGTATDLFYKGNAEKWIKLVNTLKMRADLTVGNYQAVVNATNVIENTEDDFEFKFGTNVLSPDTRHPNYIGHYTDNGATSFYLSNWLMFIMVGENGDEGPDSDPRRRYYFYRQSWRNGSYSLIEDVLGLIGDPGEIYAFAAEVGEECELQQLPHFDFTPDAEIACGVKLGYSGRHHGGGGGIPPDNFERTATGVYPAGGKFDAVADAFPWIGQGIDIEQQVGLGSGGGGAGIEAIYLASYVDFMKAEANLALGNTAGAAVHFEAGLTKSIAKVQSFGALDGGADFSQAPNEETVAAFITMKVDEFNNADLTTGLNGFGWPVEKDKMDILGEQYFITMFGGGFDAFNFIRRTGYPRTLQRNVEPIPGPFPRTLLYPSFETISNPNMPRRTDNNTKVFWDKGVLNPAN
jgi:hypothetical protein